MLATLPESRRAARPLPRAGTAASVAAHTALFALAVAATGRAAPRPARPDSQRLVYVAPHPPAEPLPPSRTHATGRPGPTSSTQTPPSRPVVRDVPSGPPVSLPSVELPPSVDPSRAAPGEFARTLQPSDGGDPSAASTPAGGVWFGAVVDVPAAPSSGNPPPAYPEALRAAGVEGRIVARFVVDTLGRVEPADVTILSAGQDPRFAAAVRAVLPRLRFRPATAGGRRVRQLVEQPFTFVLAR